MKHATPEALRQLTELLERLRAVPGLVEKRPGVFYRKGRAFLHFHEDPAGLFADWRPGEEWLRLAVGTAEGQEALLAALSAKPG
ncbi:MAG: hypothetical protein WDN69_37000 [Aliidongia sp.]